jgi:hypothetical protein
MLGMNRRIAIILGLILLAVVAYGASPYVAVARFANDLRRQDAASAIARIDIPAVRTSIARQVARQVLARNPQLAANSPLGPQAASMIAAGAVNAYLAETFTPQALAEMLGTGRLPASVAGAASGRFPALPDVTDAASLLRRAGFTGIRSFAVDVPGSDGDTALVFGIRGVTWTLIAINLPAPLLDRLTSEISSKLSTS